MDNIKKQVFTLMTGTSIAQVIPVLSMPLLSRLYSPEDFGRYALYLSLSAIISAVACGRYEHAILLPKRKGQAVNIVFLCVFILGLVSLSSLIMLFVASRVFNLFVGDDSFEIIFYFIPITVLLTGLNQIFLNWLNRNTEYYLISRARVFQSLGVTVLSAILGMFAFGPYGLVLGNLFGLAISSVIILKHSFASDHYLFNNSLSKLRIKGLARRYVNFPKYDLFATFFNISSHQLPHTFLNIFFGPSSSGAYYMAQKVFGLPISLIAASIQEVIRQKLAVSYSTTSESRDLFMKVLKWLVLCAALPTIFIYYFSMDLFVFAFGDKWETAGRFVQILLPAFYLRFVCFPLSYMFYIAEKQKVNLVGQTFFCLSIILSFIVGQNFSVDLTLYLIMISTSLFYMSYLFLSYRFTYKYTGVN